MTVVARTTASLSLEARAALHTYVEVALENRTIPYFNDDVARLGVLLTALHTIGGTWQDVLDLLALHEDHLDEFLSFYPARARWVALGGTLEEVAA